MNSNFETEYRAVRESGAGLFDFPKRGLIEVSGGEAVQFLNGMLTNDIAKLPENSWMLAAFPNVQGRLLAFVRVLKIGDKFLFDTEAATREKVFNNLFRFTFAGDFKVRDLSEEMNLLSIQGRRAGEFAAKILSSAPTSKSEISNLKFQNETVFVIPATHTAEDGFDLFAPTNLIQDLAKEFENAGAVKIGDETREVLRIEAGIPLYGVDMDETTVVLETGLDEAVSFTKGCYVGQEVIIRIHHRGHVAKKLAGLIFDEPADVAPNSELKSPEGKNAGRITSVAFSPALNKQIALAYVRYDFLQPETELLVNAEKRAKVAQLPFVGGNLD
ncbi:MAG TPA: glycine cleavage T C-terminal barrel domain-containing protein [Pyrinomonadaceae bacterium]|nr:glycine cleavage T C-terminal barrel domain-containing protein [Pyrinomonadaceae bacterium]